MQPSSVDLDLGIYMDLEMTMKDHVAKIAAVRLYHIRRLRQLRRWVGQEVTQQLILAVISAGLL